jgi:hypothetical protein
MDPITVTIIVIIGGYSVHKGINPFMILAGILGLLVALTPLAGIISVIANYQQGTLTHEHVGAAIYVTVLIGGIFVFNDDAFKFILLWTVGFFAFVTFVPKEVATYLCVGLVFLVLLVLLSFAFIALYKKFK